MKIGILSDTHGLWRPQIVEHFAGAAAILHAGDVGTLRILERLEEIAPLAAVRGNVDEFGETSCLPAEVEKEICGVRFLVRHIGSTVEGAPTDLKRLLTRQAVNVFVFGHSHRPYEAYLGRTLFLNPGAAGPRRFRLTASVAVMEIGGGNISWKICPLSD